MHKSSGKLYWYGPEASGGNEILAETDGSGTVTTEYVYFGGKRIAMLPAAGSPQYYVEDFLGSSRVVTQSNGVVCYDADFTPFGGDISYTNSCPAQNNYKFEGKERDTETGNDDFGARYYTWRFGRWLSADWSSVPVAVPYANLTNPQTLNLYAMVADDPESFADLDGHEAEGGPEAGTAGGGTLDARTTQSNGTKTPPPEGEPQLPPTTPTQNTTANQQPAQNLSAHDIAQIIKSAQASSSDAVTTAISMFNNLGQNVTASGDALRAGMKEANFAMPDALAPMVSNATSLSKSGNAVTIESAKEAKYQIGDNTIRVDKTLRFNVEVGKGTAAITGISGLSARKGFLWPGINEVRYTSTGRNTGNLEIKSWITKRLSCTSDGCQ